MKEQLKTIFPDESGIQAAGSLYYQEEHHLSEEKNIVNLNPLKDRVEILRKSRGVLSANSSSSILRNILIDLAP